MPADPVLLYVTGFDPAARAFRYEVNRAFGATAAHRPVHAPFALTLQVRMSVGADPAYQALDALVAAGRAYARPVSVQVRLDALLGDFAAAVSAAETASGTEAQERARAMNEPAWVVVERGLEDVRRILSPGQITRLPADVSHSRRGQPFFAPRPMVIPLAEP